MRKTAEFEIIRDATFYSIVRNQDIAGYGYDEFSPRKIVGLICGDDGEI